MCFLFKTMCYNYFLPDYEKIQISYTIFTLNRSQLKNTVIKMFRIGKTKLIAVLLKQR